MNQKAGPGKAPAEQVLKDIRRQTRRHYSAEEKIRIRAGRIARRGEHLRALSARGHRRLKPRRRTDSHWRSLPLFAEAISVTRWDAFLNSSEPDMPELRQFQLLAQGADPSEHVEVRAEDRAARVVADAPSVVGR